MCVWCASGTFRIDPQHGRSRVYAQWVDNEDKIEVRFSFSVPASTRQSWLSCHVIATVHYLCCCADFFLRIGSSSDLIRTFALGQTNVRAEMLLWLDLHSQQLCWPT